MHEDCIYYSVCLDKCKQVCVEYSEMKYLLDNSYIPKAQQCVHKLYPDECDLPAFEKLAEIQQDIVEFTNRGSLLYIYGTCGNGKTTWSIKLMLQYFHEICIGNCLREKGMFLNVPYLLMLTKDFNNPSSINKLNHIKNVICDLDLVIFDDIGISDLSSYDLTSLMSYIDLRVVNRKATIFTGNLKPSDLTKTVGQRLSSRICAGENIELKGQDMRNGTTTIIK